jgi:hypothetical protein
MMEIFTEGLHDTSWENDEGDKITLIDLLNATEGISVQKISVEELKPHLLSWDGNEEEIKKIENADLQYPILIFVDDNGKFITIIDGHHRVQKAIKKGLEKINAKVIPINSLPKNIKKVFKHLNKNNSRLICNLQKLVEDGITNEDRPPINVLRRLPVIEKLLDVTLNNSYPCDYDNVEDYKLWVIYDIDTFLSAYELEGMSSDDIKNFIYEHLNDKIEKHYYNKIESC